MQDPEVPLSPDAAVVYYSLHALPKAGACKGWVAWQPVLEKMIKDNPPLEQVFQWMQVHHRALGYKLPARITVRDWLLKCRKENEQARGQCESEECPSISVVDQASGSKLSHHGESWETAKTAFPPPESPSSAKSDAPLLKPTAVNQPSSDDPIAKAKAASILELRIEELKKDEFFPGRYVEVHTELYRLRRGGEEPGGSTIRVLEKKAAAILAAVL